MINSPEEFIRLRTSERQEEYARAARESAPIEVWEALIERHPEMRFWVAQNKTVPVAILERLVHDEDPRVRAMVAAKRKLPSRLQVILAADPDESVRERLVHNAKAPPEVLATIAAGSGRVAREAQRRMSFPKCPKCNAEIRELPALEPGVETRIRELARPGRHPIMAMAELRAATGWDLAKCKAWVVHQGKPCPPTETAPCPYCAKPLRTKFAKQCRHCKRDWHDQNNLRMLG
jgi:hypothetical protein